MLEVQTIFKSVHWSVKPSSAVVDDKLNNMRKPELSNSMP